MSKNGNLAQSDLTEVDGWAELTPRTAAAFLAACAFIVLHYSVRPRITKPYGAYRDLAMQRLVKRLYGILAATPGYSNHGLGIAFDMDNVTAIARAVGGIAILDGIMARFGFNRNASNGSGGIEEWHYTLVAVVDLTGVAGMDPTHVTPLAIEQRKIMELWFCTDNNGPLWTLVDFANREFDQTRDQGRANLWAILYCPTNTAKPINSSGNLAMAMPGLKHVPWPFPHK